MFKKGYTRRYRRKRYTRKRGSSYKAMAKIASKVVSRQAEKKWFTTDYSGSSPGVGESVTTIGTLNSFESPALGTSVNDRIGNKIRISSLQMRGTWILGDNANICRMIIFQWLSKAPTSPQVTDILETNPLLTVSNVTTESLYQKTNSGSYRILYDKTWSLTDNSNEQVPFKFSITKFPKRVVEFNSGTTVGYNQLHYLLISDSSAVVHPGIRFQGRMNYTDF